MNREIKFRAWHKKRKKFYKVLHLHLNSSEGIWSTVEGFDVIEQKEIHLQIQPKDCVIVQFTGLQDKNGKEIYEGDILRVTDKDNEFEPEYIGEVKYDSEICMFLVGNNPFETAFTKIKFEVIGNIHENPAK